MSPGLLVDRLPLWGVFLVTLGIVLLSIRVGFYLGAKAREEHPEGPVGSVVGAMLGLLAFILAFTFGLAASRYDTRKQLLLDEVNAIATAVRRSELLPEPYRTESRALLKRYVDLRVEVARDPRKLPEAITQSATLQDRLWSQAIVLAQANMNSDIGALYIESLNDLISLQRSRLIVGLQYRIPTGIWNGLLLMTVFSMVAVGFQFGQAGRGSVPMNLALALAFSAVVWLIANLNRSTEGTLQISQRPMFELQRELATPPQETAVKP